MRGRHIGRNRQLPAVRPASRQRHRWPGLLQRRLRLRLPDFPARERLEARPTCGSAGDGMIWRRNRQFVAALPITGDSIMIKKAARSAVALWNDTQGMILPYVTMMLVVIVGLSVLALDGARLMSLQTQLQNGADALALAAAAELDRMPDSESRSTTALNNLVANSVFFGGGNSAVRVSRIEFFSQLPATDSSPIAEGVVASDPMAARFISVSVQPVRLTTILPASLFGGASAVAMRASAVAGFDEVV